MSDLRRQKRKAIRESKKNKSTTKINEDLAIVLDAYLNDANWFIKQKNLCDELGMEYPKNATSGHMLPLFNKNPITNDIEIHTESITLFTSYQLVQQLASMTLGMDDDSSEYIFTEMLIGVINYDPKFGGYLYDLMATGKEKGKAFEKVVKDNEEEITEKMEGILIEMLK